MEDMYTNWNSGLRKDGETPTYSYSFDRKSTVAYADVEKLIEDSLLSGIFTGINDLYVKVINGTCRHTSHSGPNGYPSKKDRCASLKRVVDPKKTKERDSQLSKAPSKKKPKKPIFKNVYKCKRRKPQKTRELSGIYHDPHNRKIKQFGTACNDGNFNRGCPFATLFNLNNVEDKAIVPAFLSKPPKVQWSVVDNKLSGPLCLYEHSSGDIGGAYVLKYASKPDVPKLSDSDIMLVASEHIQPSNAITTGTITRAYNTSCQKGPQPIFQAAHNNLDLPLYSRNFKGKSYSTMGVSLIKLATNNNESEGGDENDGVEYALPNILEKFNNR